jgi:hypothetical protein
VLIVCHTLRFRLHGTQTFHICHCRGHFPFNIFPTEEVGASKPTRTLRCKRLRVLCLHYFLDKDFVQLDPATAAQLIHIHIYIYTYRERENIYTHRHISSKKTKNFHPQPISPNSYHGCPTFTGAGMCFTRRPALKTARTMEATPIILGSLGASPGSMERFMTFLLAYICILYIYICIHMYIYGKLKKWEIYGKSIPFIKHGLGNSKNFPMSTTPEGPNFMVPIWPQLGSPHLQTCPYDEQ